jgi:23S rRNA (uracil1939-C5)-methyltransferase
MAARREITILVEGLSDDGLGVARFDGRECRVRNALPGELLLARIRKRRRGVWYGDASTPDQGAATRVPAPCGAYPACGGCALQHVEYAAQVRHKERAMLRLLDEAGVTPVRVRAPVTGPRFHYRHKARLGVRRVGGEVLIGFREGFSNRIVRMSDCKTLAEPASRILPLLAETLQTLDAADRVPQIEFACGDVEVALIVRHLDPLRPEDEARLARMALAAGCRLYAQPGGYETVRPLGAAGERPYLHYSIPEYGLLLEFLPTDFTQVNPCVNRALVRSAVCALGARTGERVADLFCGIGNFSLALARQGVQVAGFESDTAAVMRARHNARLNRLSERAEFAVLDLYDPACPELPQWDRLLLDPPRSGAGPNLGRWIASRELERIVYVSCNPRSLAADSAVLCAAGFTLTEVGVFDMFPHTAHIEALAVFDRSP